jgi:hypothetical protein
MNREKRKKPSKNLPAVNEAINVAQTVSRARYSQVLHARDSHRKL